MLLYAYPVCRGRQGRSRQWRQRAESGSWSTAGTGGIAVSSGRRGHCQSVVADRIFRLSSFAAAPVTNPPSMTNSEPVMKLDSSDARNSASFATSSASPARPIGVSSIKAFTRVCRPCKNGVSIAPGKITLTRTPRSASSRPPSELGHEAPTYLRYRRGAANRLRLQSMKC